MISTRRTFVAATAASTATLLIGACKRAEAEKEVGAVEDLMREHGVLRRALVVYREAAARLRSHGDVPPDALRKTAKLFREFGEDYHEKKLEEAFIFPAVKKTTGKAAALPDVLVVQHQRGREITEYILAVTQAPKLGANAEALATVLDGFARMYESHAAREDTIVFPAWKATLSEKQLDELGDKFESIEHEQFGKDGFDDAVKRIEEVEASMGLTDIAPLTTPPPPPPT